MMEKVNYRVQWLMIISFKGFSHSALVHHNFLPLLFPEAVL